MKQIMNHKTAQETLTRREMYVETNIRTRSCNYCGSGKAINITYSESVFVASGTQHAMRTRHLSLWPAPLYNIYPHYLIKSKIFGGKKLLNTKCVF